MSKWAILRAAIAKFRQDDMTDWAAALTYYGLLSLFPALIALISLVGLFADPQETTRKLTEIVNQIGPETASDTFAGPIESLTSNRAASGALLVVGLLASLWSASGYVGAFMRAANSVHDTSEERPFWKLRPLQLALTLAMVLLLAIVSVSLVLTGPVVDAVAEPVGIGGAATTVWDIAKWPIILAIVMLAVALLYQVSPDVQTRRFKLFTPGSAIAIVVWIIVSAAFALYVANFGAYNETYGALGGVVVLLIWIWLGNVSLLLGAEVDAEIARARTAAPA